LSRRPVIAVDFDGVIHNVALQRGRELGPPCAGARDGMLELRRRGEVVVWTAKAQTETGAAMVREWLIEHDITFDRIEGKLTAALYIDDRALRHQDWRSTLEALDHPGVLGP